MNMLDILICSVNCHKNEILCSKTDVVSVSKVKYQLLNFFPCYKIHVHIAANEKG